MEGLGRMVEVVRPVCLTVCLTVCHYYITNYLLPLKGESK